MSEFKLKLTWKRSSPDFSYANYNRSHEWDFLNGTVVEGSAAPDYQGDKDLVNPEQAFVASLSSCHMLTFLAIASKSGYVVDSYTDEPVGILAKSEKGKLMMTKVTLYPKVTFGEKKVPNEQELTALHDKAHHNCFIASSVLTEVTVVS